MVTSATVLPAAFSVSNAGWPGRRRPGGNQERKAGELPCPGPDAGVVIRPCSLHRDEPLTATAVTLWLAARRSAAPAGHEIPFVCVPAGTRNHFALDAGVDRHDLTGALDAFTDGVERQIDMGEVNGRAFLNNASLGIYGDAVRSPAYRDAKVRTLLETAAEVMGPSAEAPALYLVDDLGREHRELVVVLVSNNPYALDRPLARGTRPTLGGGQLGIVVVEAPGDSPRPPGRAWSAPCLEVSAAEPVHAGVDGEAVELSPPLRFAIRPTALRVRISSRHPGASPSARLHLPGHPPRS